MLLRVDNHATPPNYAEATLGAAGLMGITFYPGYNCITPPNYAEATLGTAGLMGITFYPGYNSITPPNFAKATLGAAGLDAHFVLLRIDSHATPSQLR